MIKKSLVLNLFFALVINLGAFCTVAASEASNRSDGHDDISLISPIELKRMLDDHDVELIDVRNTDEFLVRHINGAKNIPLSILDIGQICNSKQKIVVQCESGVRSTQAAIKLKKLSSNIEVYSLDGGIKNWEKTGYSIIKNETYNKLPITRQVQMIAGSIIILGVILTLFVSKTFIIVPFFVGSGLLFAGISGWCGMAKLLAFMPWN